MHGLEVTCFFVSIHIELRIQRKILILFVLVLVAEDVLVGGSSLESDVGSMDLLN
jgi:hypothetical protein